MADALSERIEAFIRSKPVAIYMKGTPENPMCGFSARTCEAIEAAGVPRTDIAACDVLTESGMREAIKRHTNWPTIPQVFIHGRFIGGCDVVTEMVESGELKTLLAGQKAGESAG